MELFSLESNLITLKVMQTVKCGDVTKKSNELHGLKEEKMDPITTLLHH